MRTKDGDIIRRCLNGEPEAFGFLVDKYRSSIYAFAYTKLGNFQDAEDVTQEVFLKAYSNLRKLRCWDSFFAWLYSITSNLCKYWVIEQAKRPDRESIHAHLPGTLDSLSVESQKEKEVHESLHEALYSLPEIYRQVLILYYFGSMNSFEIASFLGASPTTIRKRLSRARSQLREEMIAMMDRAFENQRLQASFTFRIVEAVKRIKIHPAPRTAGLPWGISLAAGIILTVLSMNPHLSLPDQIGSPKGSPLPVEMKVLKTGEIPVDVLKISQTLAISSKQGDGNGGELRPDDDERGAFLLAPQASEMKLLPRDGAAGDCFGGPVSIHGDYAIVGAIPKDDWKGVAYIFKSDGSSWKEQQMLFADDGRKDDWFGEAVAINDEFAFVGIPGDDDVGDGTGSVCVFRRTGESWTQQAKLYPHGQFIKWCSFGWSMAVSGDYLVVGSPREEGTGGAIYIFKRDGDAWNEQDKLISSDRREGDRFGQIVSISSDYVIATAPYRKNNTGAAYIFKREGDTWKEQAILTSDDVKEEDWFGGSAFISGDYAMVGAYGVNEWSGAAYVFVRDGSSWKQQAKLMPDDVAKGDCFGSCICISDDYVIVGSTWAGGKGAIYGFMQEGDLWKQVSKRVASDGAKDDKFGSAAAFSGNYVIVGAHKADVNGEDSGAAYIYNYAEFFPVEPSGSSATTFGGEKDKPALRDTLIPPPAKQAVPGEFRLLQNFPNPFNPETWLPYELASEANVVIRIHNSRGELVRRLNLGKQEAGFYTTRDKAAYWDGRNETGEPVASDVYFYFMRAGEYTDLRKMVIVR